MDELNSGLEVNNTESKEFHRLMADEIDYGFRESLKLAWGRYWKHLVGNKLNAGSSLSFQSVIKLLRGSDFSCLSSVLHMNFRHSHISKQGSQVVHVLGNC